MSASQPVTVLERNKQLVLRWFEEVWNQGRRETVPELLHGHGVLHDGARDLQGPHGFFGFYDDLRSQFTDFRVTPITVLAEDNLVCMHWAADFRHKQSGKSIHITGTSVVRVEDNRFVEAWQNWDLASLQSQLTAP